MDMNQIGNALSGFSAGVSGNLPQWQQSMTARQTALADLDEKRQAAMAKDFRTGRMMLESGDLGSFNSLMQDRLDKLVKLGGDPTHTTNLLRMVQEGRTDEALGKLKQFEQVAVAEGLLGDMRDEHIGNKDGQDIFRRADGSTYAKPTEGWSAEVAAKSGSSELPSTVREWEYYNALSPEDQSRFRQMKRASVYQDLGGGARGMVDGSTVTPVTTGPGQTVDQFRDEYATAEGNLEQVTQQAGGLGKDAATASTSNFEMYTAVKQGLKSYDKAIAAIDKGASSGRIQSLFPSIKSSTIELENLRSKLGLDVVAASKFGALSEGELRLALEVAVPNLPGPELKKWLIDRKAAQAKLADYYKDVAIYLGKKGNTLPKYLEEMEAKTAESRASANPDLPTDTPPPSPTGTVRFLGFE